MKFMFRLLQRKQPKVLLIGLDCAEPSLVFDSLAEEMPNLTRLREEGAYGRLESVIPPITVPAWACMLTGKQPGDLGIYGFRNRTDYSYDGLGIVTSRDVQVPAVWDSLGEAGKQSIVIGVPPGYPPKPIHGHSISCFLTPNSEKAFTHPPQLKPEILDHFGDYTFDVRNFRTEDKGWLLDQIFRLSEQRFEVARYLMTTKPWDFFAMVDMGPDRLHHGFWKFADPEHRRYQPGNPFEHALRDYYRFLDEKLGQFMADVPDRAQVLVVSDHGAKQMDGGICVNEWLIREGYLRLKGYPEETTRLEDLEVDWSRTVAWGEGGYYGRIFLNVEDREPEGVVPPDGYEAVRDELVTKLEALGDEGGKPIGTRVYKPQELYERINGIPPDLIAIFGDLHWRSVGTVGWNAVHVHENDTGPDDANHAQHGMLVAHNIKGLRGELEDRHITQIAATVLERMGQGVPPEFPHAGIEVEAPASSV